MRVLWFADARLPAGDGGAPAGGGWIEGLRRALEAHAPDVVLGIATPGPEGRAPLVLGSTTYFSIVTRKVEGRAAQAMSRWRHDPVPSSGLASCVAIARSFAPDVVHVHGTEHYFGLLCRELAAPVVVSLQGMATVLQRHSLDALDAGDLVREAATREFWRGEGPLHAARVMRARAGVEGRVISSCDDFMGRTDWDRAVLRLLRPEARYHAAGEVLGEPFYTTTWSGPDTGGETLYCTGGASATKGVETLLEALVLLRRAGVFGPRLRLAGGVTDGLLARKVRRLLDARELRGAVDLLGRCTPAQVAQELAGANAFVMPSHMENSPNTLCEAMLVGAPCIAAFVGGVPSLVRDGVDGLLYNDTDPFALAGAIDRLLSDPALAGRLGAAARETAVRRHDPEIVARQVTEVYSDVVSRWRERRHQREDRAGGGPAGQEVVP